VLLNLFYPGISLSAIPYTTAKSGDRDINLGPPKEWNGAPGNTLPNCTIYSVYSAQPLTSVRILFPQDLTRLVCQTGAATVATHLTTRPCRRGTLVNFVRHIDGLKSIIRQSEIWWYDTFSSLMADKQNERANYVSFLSTLSHWKIALYCSWQLLLTAIKCHWFSRKLKACSRFHTRNHTVS